MPLTADNGSWNGSPTAYAYQWQRCDTSGASCNPIGGATAPTYTPLAGDVGKTLRVVVTATNASGSTPASSNATAVVQAAAPSTLGRTSVGASTNQGWGDFIDLSGPYALASAGSVTKMTGYVQGGSASEQIRAVVYADNAGQPGAFVAVSSADDGRGRPGGGLGRLQLLGRADPRQRQLLARLLVLDPLRARVLHPGQRRRPVQARSVLVEQQPGGQLRRRHLPERLLLALRHPRQRRQRADEHGAAGDQRRSGGGAPVVGDTLTTTNGSWANSPTSYAYQWQRCDTGGASCNPIGGATGQTYTPVAGDVGNTLRVAVTATNATGSSAPATSNATAVVTAAASAPTNTTLPAISGGASATQGVPLTADNGSWNGNPTRFSYQWQQCDTSGASCNPIGGATNQTYTPLAGDVGNTLRVAVTATNATGSSVPATSAATAVVTAAASRRRTPPCRRSPAGRARPRACR